MRRTVLLALALALAGCGQQTVERPRPEARAAGPQETTLGWRETYPDRTKDRLVFEVESFRVTEDGWSAAVALRNETTVPFAAQPGPASSRYGLMLFATGSLDEAQSSGSTPPVRTPDAIEPPPPRVLAPGATWRGRLSSRGSLPAQAYVRIVFGPLAAEDDAPEGMDSEFVWITDRTFRLRP